nr:PREDICTED: mitotic spindle assembly checkpoint protein MAD1 isoform X3 [Lepisosteus oculatus]
MDNMQDNTTVFNTLKSFESFLSQHDASTSQPETSASKSDLQFQYNYQFKVEEEAQKIFSKTHLLQMAQEKSQMEFSHKRARIELEKAAHTSARDLEREVDRNQDLLARIRKLEEKESEAGKALKEQTEISRSLKKTIEGQNKKLEEKDSKLAEANETSRALRDEIRELHHKIKNQEIQLTTQTTENQGLQEQLELLHKKCQEATQKIQALQMYPSLNSENELKIKELERRLAMQEQDSVIVRNMKSELGRIPDMEKELQQLREENAYLRETKENNNLLKEEAEGMRKKLERVEKMKEDLVKLELEKEKLSLKLQAWQNLEQMTGLNIRRPEDLSGEIIQFQQREITLKQQNYSVTSSARALEKVRLELQNELLQLRAKLLEEQKRREQQDALVRRLQKRVLLLTKERDGAQLSKAQEEAGAYKLQAQVAEAEIDILKKQAATADNSSFVSTEEVNSLRQKIEELEAERRRLEEQNNMLEMRLERHNLQGDYDPTKVKVLHFRMNPASQARQQRAQDAEQLRQELQRLKEHIQLLQAGGAVAAEEGPLSLPPSQEVLDLRKQVESAELKNQRLKEIFQKKIQEFRKVCYMLTGYQIDITTENQYRLTSVYTERVEDSLLFKASGPTGGNMQLLETDFSRTLHDLVELHLFHQKSIPAFLSAVTLELFSRQTII